MSTPNSVGDAVVSEPQPVLQEQPAPQDPIGSEEDTKDVMDVAGDADAPKESMLDYACGFFHWNVLRHMLCLSLVGVSTGWSGGMNGPWLVLQEYSEDCSMYTTAGACGNVMNQDCIWNTETASCDWRVGMCSQLGTDSANCGDRGMMKCHYDYDDDKCVNTVGFSSLYSGIFGCVPMVMQVALGLFAGDFLAFLHHRVTFMLAGFLFTLGSVLQHIGVASNEFWVSTMGRYCLGFSCIFMTVPGMVYVNQNAPQRYKQVLVSFYCVVNNLGQLLPAAIGGALGLTVDFASSGKQLYLHFQLNCAFCTLTGVAFMLMGYLIEESPYWANEDPEEPTAGETKELENVEDLDDKELLQKVDDMEKAHGINVAEFSWFSMAGRLVIGMSVAGVVQLTGISAFGNYAPIITGRLGINGLVGSIMIQAWNVFSASMSIIILGMTSNLRMVLLIGTFIAAVASLMVGVLIFPGVIKDDSTRNGVSIAFIAMYILSFQSCIGGAFYPLTQEMFPLSFRPRGASFMTMTLMLFAFLISVCFPIAMQGLSGGANGNQNKGMAIIMFFFGAVGFIGFVVIFLFLRPWTAEDEKIARAKSQIGGAAAADAPPAEVQEAASTDNDE